MEAPALWRGFFVGESPMPADLPRPKQPADVPGSAGVKTIKKRAPTRCSRRLDHCTWISRYVLGSADLDLPHHPSAPSPDPLELITAGIVAVAVVIRRKAETYPGTTEAAEAAEAMTTEAAVTTSEMTATAVTYAAVTAGSKRATAPADRHSGYGCNCQKLTHHHSP
jgi:hypothetical protein